MWSVFGGACSVPILLLVGLSVAILWRWWRMRTAERIPIARASRSAGYCEVAGTVEGRDPFTHPLAEGPVAWMSIAAELDLEPTPAEPGDRRRQLVAELGESIWLRDETGLARVRPTAADVEVREPVAVDYQRRRDGEPPPWVVDLAARSAEPIDPSRVLAARGVAAIVRPGEPVYVLGWARPERGGEALYRDAEVIPVFRRGRRRPLLVANVEEAELETHELGLAVLVLFVAGLATVAWWALFGALG